MEGNSSSSSASQYLLNFSFSQKRLSANESLELVNNQMSKNSMSSNVISETSLEEDHILLKKKSLLKRKSMGSLKIFYGEIIDLKLINSNVSSLYSSIVIAYSKNGYTKHLIALSSSDSFALRWFYDELVVRYSLKRSNLNGPNILKSNEENFLNENNLNSRDFNDFDEFMNQMNAEISDKRKKEISKQMKFDRCSSGEY